MEKETKTLELYTDGAFSPLKNVGGIGIVFILNGKKIYTYNKKIENTTNNKCELIAVITALNAISKPIDNIIIYTDSQYVLGCATKGWKRKKNVELWKKYDEILTKASSFCKNISFEWVKGHDENEYNNLADKLAVEASKLV